MKSELNSVGDFKDSTLSLADSVDSAYSLVGNLSILALIGYFIGQIGWTYSVAKVAYDIDAVSTKRKPGWAIGSWFIPVANLFMPLSILLRSFKVISVRNFSSHLAIWWIGYWTLNLASRAITTVSDSEIAKINSVSSINDWNSIVDTITFLYQLEIVALIVGIVSTISLYRVATNFTEIKEVQDFDSFTDKESVGE